MSANALHSYPKVWPREELAWAAGFFDGEGSISAYTDRRDGLPYIALNVAQRDRRALLRLQRLFGFGGVGKPNAKGVSYWQVYGHEKVQAVVAALWPFLIVKREQAAAKLADHLAAKREYPYQRIVTITPEGRTWKSV